MNIVFLLIIVFVVMPFAIGNQVKQREKEFNNINKKNEKSPQNPNTP